MKVWKVKIEFVGLAGTYMSEFETRARTRKSAEKKAFAVVGDRSYNYIVVYPFGWMGCEKDDSGKRF